MMKRLIAAAAVVGLLAGEVAVAHAAPILLVASNGFINQPPFESIGPEDIDLRELFPNEPRLVWGQFAVSSRGYYMDSAVSLYDFGSVGAVTSASLTLQIGQIWSVPGIRPIVQMFVYGDADGRNQLDDLFSGTVSDSQKYWRPGTRTFDVTAPVNAALSSSRYVAFRFQSPLPSVDGISGFAFSQIPTLDVPALPARDDVTIPEPASMFLLGSGLVAFGMRQRIRHAKRQKEAGVSWQGIAS